MAEVLGEVFKEFLRTAERGRSGISERILAKDELPVAARIYAANCPESGHSPQWSYLSSGFIAFKAPPGRALVAFVRGIGQTVYAGSLFGQLFHEIFLPIHGVLVAAGMNRPDVQAYCLDLGIVGYAADRVRLRMQGAELAKRRPMKRAAPVKAQRWEMRTSPPWRMSRNCGRNSATTGVTSAQPVRAMGRSSRASLTR